MDCPQYRCTSREFPQKQSLGGGEEGRRGGEGGEGSACGERVQQHNRPT